VSRIREKVRFFRESHRTAFGFCGLLTICGLIYIGLWSGVFNVPFLTGVTNYRGFSLTVRREMDLHVFLGGVAVAWSPTGSKLAIASNYGGTLSIWDAGGNKEYEITHIGGGGPVLGHSLGFIENDSHLVFSPRGDAAKDESINIFNLKNGGTVTHITGPEPGKEEVFNKAQHFSLTSDKILLLMSTNVFSAYKENLVVYSTKSWEITHTKNVRGSVESVSVCGDSHLVAVGTSVGEESIFDLDSGDILGTSKPFSGTGFESASVFSVACSPKGDFFFGGSFGSWSAPLASDADNRLAGPATVRRSSDNALVASIQAVHPPILQATWDPKGRYVAFIDSVGFLYIWEPLSPDAGYEKIDLGGKSFSLAANPDGTQIAVTTGQGVRIFSVK